LAGLSEWTSLQRGAIPASFLMTTPSLQLLVEDQRSQAEPAVQKPAPEFATLSPEDETRLLAAAASERPAFISDEQDRITFWSRGAEQLLGYSPAEVIGRRLESLAGEAMFGPAKFADSPKSPAQKPQVTTWLRHKNGARFWCSLSCDAFQSAPGETVFVTFLTDLTERKLQEDNLRTSNDHKDRLLANVSHELRTPLSAILLWSQLFEEQPVVDPTQLKEGMEVIRKSACEQRELIEDLIDMIGIGQGKLRLEPVLVDLASETLSGLSASRIAAREKGVDLAECIAPDLGIAQVDPHRWKQIIWNLLGNAVKFTPLGGKVTISVIRNGDLITIRVSDTGKGIAADFLPSIFERFGQADNSTKRAHSGLGLGLGITRELVKLHGGTISAESRGLGHGAVFTVELPLPAIVHTPLRQPQTKTGIVGQLKSRHILVVEDCAETREALVAVLTEAGASVVATSSASAALYEFRANPPDLLVSDLGLPHMDGSDLIMKIRMMEKMLRCPPVPALVLTAHAGEAELRRALQSGFSKHLAKPVEPLQLVQILCSMAPQRMLVNCE
jgi:PAS domain S-box-containing protein